MPRQFTPNQKESNWHYLLRRQLEGGPFRILFAGGLLLGAFGVIPYTIEGLQALFGTDHHITFATTLSMIVSGGSVGAWAVSRLKTSNEGMMLKIIAPLGAALMVFGLLILCYRLAGMILLTWADAVLPMETTPISELGHAPWILGLAAIGVAVTVARCIPANYVSIGRFYRDRLMESFLPDWEAVEANSNDAAREANLAFIQNIPDPDRPRGPLHLVNTNVVLKDSPKPAHRQRLGDDFVFSPLYCGGPVTGWAKAEDYLRGQMTLATTMAISGAAINPHSGVSGGGISAGFLISLLMNMLNVHLGYWVEHPCPKRLNWKEKFGNVLLGRGMLRPIWADLSGGYRDGGMLNLSDGGHFENLGVYALLRRKTRCILAVDAEQDGNYTFAGLGALTDRAAADFGARIEWSEDYSIEHIIPTVPTGPSFPSGATVSKRGFACTSIEYDDGSKGVLLYIKTAPIKTANKRVESYRQGHPDFPDQTTADQFFDESQFEAYRELGYRIAEQAMKEVGKKKEKNPVAQRIRQALGIPARAPA